MSGDAVVLASSMWEALVAAATAVTGHPQQCQQLLPETGTPPRVDEEVGRRVDGEQEVRERDDLGII